MGGQRQEDFLSLDYYKVLKELIVQKVPLTQFVGLTIPIELNINFIQRKLSSVVQTRTHISPECEQNGRENQVGERVSDG